MLQVWGEGTLQQELPKKQKVQCQGTSAGDARGRQEKGARGSYRGARGQERERTRGFLIRSTKIAASLSKRPEQKDFSTNFYATLDTITSCTVEELKGVKIYIVERKQEERKEKKKPQKEGPLPCKKEKEKTKSVPKPEMRHSLQRRFRGQKMTPGTAQWMAQRLTEAKEEKRTGILGLWVHPKRQPEVSQQTATELNELSDEDVVTALYELRQPKKIIRGKGGNQMTIPIHLQTLDGNQNFRVDALLDSGSTGSCISERFIRENNIPT